MGVEVRGELHGDEEGIDAVNCSAFGSLDEANIVRLMRAYHPCFDRRYSLVACDGSEVIGHALLTPARIRLMGETLDAVAVGPVAVTPARQREGVGGLLMRRAHELARADGYALAFLYGHPSYYTRFGYRPCLGLGRVRLDTSKLPDPTRGLITLPVQESDTDWIAKLWEREWSAVDFGWLWGKGLTE